jgi:glycosyltransferase involved in cell wall biosynthesis
LVEAAIASRRDDELSRRSMRLLFCCESYPPVGGGVAEVMRQIAEGMVRAGHEVVVATTHVPGRHIDVINGVRVRGFRVDGNMARGLTGEVESYRDFVVDSRADAVLIKAAQQWTFDALWPVLDRIAARKVFIPCGFSGLYESSFAEYYKELPAVLRKFDHLIFYADNYRDIDFARAHGIAKFSVVPNGASEAEFDTLMDPAIRARLGAGARDFIFLTVGNPILMKGHRELVEAYARLATDGQPTVLILNASWPQSWRPPAGIGLLQPVVTSLWRVWQAVRPIAGVVYRSGQALQRTGWRGFRAHWRTGMRRRRSWRELEWWIARARAQPGKKVVCVDLPRAELIETFKAADLFVFASSIEYSPLVLYEAAAAGTPFLSVPVGNAEEIARWTGAGVICPATQDGDGYTRVDPRVLAQEMRRCMKDSALLVRLGRSGKENWRARFTWDKIVPEYEAVLRGCVPAVAVPPASQRRVS